MQENVINKIYIDGEFVTPHGNDTNYGLQAYVFSSDPARAHRVASRLEAGRVAINGGYEPLSPFGGSSSRALGGNTVPSVLRAFSNRGK
jgi:aldehyde dehydrogenase (NAD+)